MATTTTKTIVAMTGASKTLVAANIHRIALQIINPTGNSPIAYDRTGGTATLVNCSPIEAGVWDYLDGDDCPNGIVTVIGTNLQNVVVYEKVRAT